MDIRNLMRRAVPMLIGVAAVCAHAGPGDFRIVVDTDRNPDSEDAALHGFVMLNEGASHSRAVGAVGRAFSLSRERGNTLWGVVTEAINFPEARGNAVGMESAVANMAHDNVGALRGLDVVFKNRMDLNYYEPVPAVGQNRFNEDSAAVYVSSQPRSPAGEYVGWQAGLKFAPSSLDRSASVPYAAAVDVSEIEIDAPYYLIVWRCGKVKCGLAPTATGAAVVFDIERATR